jgi:hypothetical protein
VPSPLDFRLSTFSSSSAFFTSRVFQGKKTPPFHHCNPGQTKAVSFGRPRTGREIRAYGDISYVTWMTPNHLTFLSLITYSMPSWEQIKAAFTSCFS